MYRLTFWRQDGSRVTWKENPTGLLTFKLKPTKSERIELAETLEKQQGTRVYRIRLNCNRWKHFENIKRLSAGINGRTKDAWSNIVMAYTG